MRCWFAITLILILGTPVLQAAPPSTIDFNRDIRPILSNNCFFCHGPDEKERHADLRLDTFEGAKADIEGHQALVPGKPEASELLLRIKSDQRSKVMPPPKTGKKLTATEIDLLTRWIQEGGKYATHWAYVVPKRPDLPTVKKEAWVKNPVDRFILSNLDKEKLTPAPEADRFALARRAALDITGLPPTRAEVEAFLRDTSPTAYEAYVDRLFAKKAYGEHWARLWLDLARYADSAGYADDPLRTIWAFRDYTIKSLNANKPFDQFTIEQIAGDLLPNPTDEQRIATSFHRNTMTNNEGGTSDEEFRNVAIVDRVNTTFTTWMGTSIACAQCHTHKYDPITQEEFFKVFAIFNNTADADRPDESPLLSFYSAEQKKQRDIWTQDIANLEKKFDTAIPGLKNQQAKWESGLKIYPRWASPKPTVRSQGGLPFKVRADQSVRFEKSAKQDTYTIEMPLEVKQLTGLRLEALTDPTLPGMGPGLGNGNFVLSRVQAKIVPPGEAKLQGRYVRISLNGPNKILSLAEVQVFKGTENIAHKGEAKQSSTTFEGPAKLALDGNTDGQFEKKSVTHTASEKDPWWEVDLKSAQPLDKIVVWNRLGPVEDRLAGYRVEVLNDKREVIWSAVNKSTPKPSASHALSGERTVSFITAFADYEQLGFGASNLVGDGKNTKGWAVGGAIGQPHTLTLLPAAPVEVPTGSKLVVTLEQKSPHDEHLLGLFRLALTDEAGIAEASKLPATLLAALQLETAKRTPEQLTAIASYYARTLAPELKAEREKLAELNRQLTAMKASTVPVMKELPITERRKTNLQNRGNFLDLGQLVTEGVPAAFHPIKSKQGKMVSRLDLAEWLVSPENPLTARVVANRFWEQIFGIGLVRSSEEFGIQGEWPSNPELLDWLATELVRLKWDQKAFLKMLVTSAAYRQSSKVNKAALERDPDNRWLATGPRVRLTAEMVRDQALAVSGLLSDKMYGPSVKPPQPALGLSAAFGGSIDWKTSEGPDRYRRGLYTEWRRSNPYPAMSTFDAPNRDICVVRRNRTNTPLQALVTLNDVVYVEAAQALARRILKEGGATNAERIHFAFQEVLARPASEEEVKRVSKLLEETRPLFEKDKARATKMAAEPIGPVPATIELTDAATWTVVCNILLNLDETLMKR
jgi:hypothetical protein